MEILVTGGAGFIGSAVSRQLADLGHKVIVLDNFNDFYDVSLKRARQKHFLSGIEVVEGSITDSTFLRRLFDRNDFKVVAHLAAQVGVLHSTKNPNLYIETNVTGTQQILEIMREFGTKRMVFASTSSIYGNNSKVPLKESDETNYPVSVYAATKKAGELLAFVYHSHYSIDVTCLRLFTVYGPWSRSDMALLKFAKLITAGKPIDVYNNGELQRDFVYIDDLVDGFVKAIEKPLGYEIINLGHGAPVKLSKFIELLETELGARAQKNFLPMQFGDVFATHADVSKAKELLNFESKVSLNQGIHRFVSWFRNHYV